MIDLAYVTVVTLHHDAGNVLGQGYAMSGVEARQLQHAWVIFLGHQAAYIRELGCRQHHSYFEGAPFVEILRDPAQGHQSIHHRVCTHYKAVIGSHAGEGVLKHAVEA